MHELTNLLVHRCLFTWYAMASACFGQITGVPGIAGAGYANPFPLHVAPGQLVTIYLQAPSGANVSATFWGQQAQPDRVHILTLCDSIEGGEPPLIGEAPCAPLIYHGNGQRVSWQNPASVGEELVAYATGLGQTNPPLSTGMPAASSSPALSSFNLDFNYRPNALATQPSTAGPPTNPPLFAGSTQGYVGLYQVNFTVPPPPAGLEPCSNLDFIAVGPVGGLVYSNFTVSVGSFISFDGAGICVTTGS